MKTLKLLSAIFLTCFIASCKGEKKEKKEIDAVVDQTYDKSVTDMDDDEVEVKTVSISLEPKSESNVTGEVVFTEDESGMVTMAAQITGLKEGEHAIHIHEKADCSSADGKSTGGHWNPTGQPHGKWGATEGYHKGDIGNFKVNADGIGDITFATNEWCIGCDDEKKNIVSKAIIVHNGIDDFTSQPSGAAGTRISCGGIIQ